MKINGDYELSEVPALMKKFRDSGGSNWLSLLSARAALLDAGEELMATSVKEARGLTADERRTFDSHVALVRDINAHLAAIKEARIKEHGADMVHLPF